MASIVTVNFPVAEISLLLKGNIVLRQVVKPFFHLSYVVYQLR